MITIIDLILVVLLGLFLIKNIGGILKTAISIIIVLIFIIVFGLISNLLLNQEAASFMRDNLKHSYFVKLSNAMIKLVYPAIEKQAPKLDNFIKEKILTTTGEVFKDTPSEKAIPKIYLPLPEPPKGK